ncbi:MAG: NAD-dependent epimerase/dehydratase family protein [Actinobacteria bacterium]|nr:NAD-dependent epimerase/dehydratase family protein [Actinomycetota bacterium]
MSTLITGATGFIGSHVAAQLIERGEPVRLFVRDPAKLADVGINPSADGVEIAVGDLLDRSTIGPALEGVRRIHHIAGAISLDRGERQRLYDLNVTTTRNLFEAARDRPIERVVYLASIYALAGAEPDPVTENSPWKLGELAVDYVQVKREAELYARACADAGMPIVFAYPTLCLGPGDVYESSSEVVNNFINGKVPAYVDGGHNVIDVRDAAAGLIAAMDSGRVGERYLLGGVDVSLEDLFRLLARVTDRRPPKLKVPGGMMRAVARLTEPIMKNPPVTMQMALMTERCWFYDDSKARRELGHTSRPLEQTVRDAVKWLEGRPVR